MNININSITGEGLVVDFQEKFDVPDSCNAENNQVEVNFKGRVRPAKDDEFRLTGAMDIICRLRCDRCLEYGENVFSAEVSEVFSNKVDEDSWFISENLVDISAAISANIYTMLPMKVICSDDCKGLCPVCGKNLNEGECGCNEPVDPRFDILSSFFEGEEV